jgi:hypothetical protein
VVVAVVVFVVAVGMTAAVVFVFFEASLVAYFAIAVPLVVMVETSAWAIPITAVVPTAFMAGSNPVRAGIGRAAPVALMPTVVAGNRVPIAADPDKVGGGLRMITTARGGGGAPI